MRAEIFRKLATVTQYIGDPDASLHYAESALELFEELGDKRGAVAMHLHIQALYTWQWDGAREDLGLKHLEAAAALVERDPDSVEKGLVFQRELVELAVTVAIADATTRICNALKIEHD